MYVGGKKEELNQYFSVDHTFILKTTSLAPNPEMNQTKAMSKAGKQAMIMEKTEIININFQFNFMFYIIPIYITIFMLNFYD